MSRLASIRERVEARVAELIVPAMFERALIVHQKRAWTICPCDWCAMKREHHARLQYSPYIIKNRYEREIIRESKVSTLRRVLAEEKERILSPGGAGVGGPE